MLSAVVFAGCDFGQAKKIRDLNIRISQLEKELEKQKDNDERYAMLEKELELAEYKGVAKAELENFAEEQGCINYTDDSWA